MATFFTSDQHFGCPKDIFYMFRRPFRNTEEHDFQLFENWYSVVKPEDTVYILGDISVGSSATQVVSLMKDLPGRKILIPGHHDLIVAEGKTFSDVIKIYEDSGFAVYDKSEMIIECETETHGKRKVLLSHYPYFYEGSTDSYRDLFPHKESNMPILHGHSHHHSRLNKHEPLALNVSVDANDFTPVSEHVVKEWLEFLIITEIID